MKNEKIGPGKTPRSVSQLWISENSSKINMFLTDIHFFKVWLRAELA